MQRNSEVQNCFAYLSSSFNPSFFTSSSFFFPAQWFNAGSGILFIIFMKYICTYLLRSVFQILSGKSNNCAKYLQKLSPEKLHCLLYILLPQISFPLSIVLFLFAFIFKIKNYRMQWKKKSGVWFYLVYEPFDNM